MSANPLWEKLQIYLTKR